MTYHIIMSDGLKQDIRATSAADAQQKALENHRGHRVKSCSSGSSSRWGEGHIDYEVPDHVPVPVEAPAPLRGKKALMRPDNTAPMFHDPTIEMESALALEHHRHESERELQALSPKTVDTQTASAAVQP